MATAAQQARMVRGSRRPFPPRRRAHESIPCATRPDAPLPASTTYRKRKVSSSCGVRIRGPHSMHWPRPGESFWALKCATRGASRGQTNPVCIVDGAVDTFGATSVSWCSQSPSVSWCMVLTVGVMVLWSCLRGRPACRAVSFHQKSRFYTHATGGTPGLVL